MEEQKSDLMGRFKNKISEIGISPVFFVGSGLSRRYFDAPDWLGLLRLVRDNWDRSFDYYHQGSFRDGEYKLDELAELMSDMFFEKIDDKELLPGKNKDFYFKNRIVEIINSFLEMYRHTFETNTEIQALKKTSPSAIITTNYDMFLEEIFPEFESYVGQQFLLSNNVGAVGEIYKIHGSVTDTESLVITKKDYDIFENKEAYLNAKLLTLFLEYPIVFLGYSLSDRNVKSILTTIVKMLPPDKVNELSKRIWFVRRTSNPISYSNTERFNLGEGLYVDVETFYLNDYSIFYNAMSSSKVQKLPIKFLKYLKNNVYKLAASQVYNPKLLDVNLTEIEKIDDFTNLNNIVGLTFKVEGKGNKDVLRNKDIIEPLLRQEECEYNEAAIKYLLQNYSTILPIHFFLQNKKHIEEYIHSFEGFSENAKQKIITRATTAQNYSSILGVNNGYEFDETELIEIELEKATIDQYVAKYNDDNGILIGSHKTVMRYFMLKLLMIKINDFLYKDDFLNDHKELILQCISNLNREFIVLHKELLLNILKKLDDQNYGSLFRKVVCHIDQALFSEI